MFSRWKKQTDSQDSSFPYTQLFELPGTEYVSMLKDMVQSNERASNAMCLVALANLPTIHWAVNEQAKKHPELNIPSDLDGHIQLIHTPGPIRFVLEGDAGSEEIAQRRRDWFLIGMLIERAMKLGEKNANCGDYVASIWINLADSARFLPALLEHNVVWSPQEKEWFAPIKSEIDGIEYVLNWMTPKWTRHISSLVEYANNNGIRNAGTKFYSPPFEENK